MLCIRCYSKYILGKYNFCVFDHNNIIEGWLGGGMVVHGSGGTYLTTESGHFFTPLGEARHRIQQHNTVHY